MGFLNEELKASKYDQGPFFVGVSVVSWVQLNGCPFVYSVSKKGEEGPVLKNALATLYKFLIFEQQAHSIIVYFCETLAFVP